MPEISVITTVYNSETYLRETIQSVLNQTFGDFEFILVNDGSTDNSLDIIRSFHDSRIILLTNFVNSGIVISRNLGLSAARGKYVAILDSDDIAMPTRFEVQRANLNDDESVGLVSSWVDIINADGTRTGSKTRRKFEGLEWNVSLLFYNSFTHSALMCRRTAFPQPAYALEIPLCEDYLLISRLAKHWKIMVIPQMLTKYRVHGSNISRMKQGLIHDCEQQIKEIALKNMGIKYTKEDSRLHQKLQSASVELTHEDFEKTLLWLRSLTNQLRSNDPDYFNALMPNVLDGVLWEFCQRASALGLKVLFSYFNTCRQFGLKIRVGRVVKLALKVFVKATTAQFKAGGIRA